jgi:hypothetical protein
MSLISRYYASEMRAVNFISDHVATAHTSVRAVGRGENRQFLFPVITHRTFRPTFG